MTASDAPPISGLLEGKYQLVGMIGRGGMGSVWEARHATLGTRFAIKFIEAEYADSTEARSRFDKEARAAATIQSKHAIQIYDHGVTSDGKPYIVMELLIGEPLDKRIEKLGRLSLQDTARILGQVSRALARAHERGIVHRDLKPENIFLVRTPDDDDEIAKVLDFGIAKMQSGVANPSVTSSTKTGAVLGTPFYMSPEQARGLRNVDHRTDVWSLGVIAFKCVTGKLPFDGESIGDLLVKICTNDPPRPSDLNAGLPDSFNAWFARALAREPDRRFQTVTELAEDLAATAGISARGPGSLHQTPPLSALSTVAASSGAGGYAHTPPPGASPAYSAASGGLGASANQPAAAAQPQPAAMTAAPFTSSQPVPGVPVPGRAKFVALAALGFALLGGGATVGLLLLKKNHDTKISAGAGMTPPPPPVSALAGAGDRLSEPSATPPSSATPPASGALAAALSKPGSAPGSGTLPKQAGAPGVPGVPASPATPGKTTTKPTSAPDKPPPPLPTHDPTPPATAPSTKKPPTLPAGPKRDDPGY